MNKGDLMKLAFDKDKYDVDAAIPAEISRRLRDELHMDPRFLVGVYPRDNANEDTRFRIANVFQELGLKLIKAQENTNQLDEAFENSKSYSDGYLEIEKMSHPMQLGRYRIIMKIHRKGVTHGLVLTPMEFIYIIRLANKIIYGLYEE